MSRTNPSVQQVLKGVKQLLEIQPSLLAGCIFIHRDSCPAHFVASLWVINSLL